MKADHGRSLALFVGRCLCALALAHVSLSAQAVNKGNIGRASQSSTGRSTTIGPVTNSGGSTIPVSPTIGGWSQAGNYGVPTGASGTTMQLGQKGDAYIAGQKYPFQAGYQTPKSDWVLPALGAAASIGCAFATGGLATVACLGLPVALPWLYDWITRSGGRINPDTGALERQTDTSTYDGRPWGCGVSTAGDTDFARCIWTKSQSITNMTLVSNCRFTGGGTASITSWCHYNPNNNDFAGGQASRLTINSSWYPSSMDDIVPYMRNVIPDGRVWGEALERGAEFPLPNPTVTGPSSIQGPEKSTVNPDGSRTVERTTYNFTTAGNTITNTTNNTNTTTYNTDNSVRSVSNTTETPTAETADKESECEKRPNSVGCQELEDPGKGVIPKETKTITYSEEAGIGGGSCPADVMWSPQSISGSYKFINWQQACGWALQLKWVVLLLATWSAFWIVMPGNTQAKPQ